MEALGVVLSLVKGLLTWWVVAMAVILAASVVGAAGIILVDVAKWVMVHFPPLYHRLKQAYRQSGILGIISTLVHTVQVLLDSVDTVPVSG